MHTTCPTTPPTPESDLSRSLYFCVSLAAVFEVLGVRTGCNATAYNDFLPSLWQQLVFVPSLCQQEDAPHTQSCSKLLQKSLTDLNQHPTSQHLRDECTVVAERERISAAGSTWC